MPFTTLVESLLALLCLTWQLEAQSPRYQVSDSIVVGLTYGDFFTFDQVNRRLYGAGPNVVDVDRKRVVGVLGDSSAGGGFIVVPKLGRGLVRNGTVFVLSTGAIIAKLPAWGDASVYEPVTGRAFLLRDTVSVIDLAKAIVVRKILVPGAAESGVADGRGKLYLNLYHKDSIAVIDARSLKMVAEYSVAPGTAPLGLAIDTVAGRLFVACDHKVVVIESASGRVVAVLAVPGQSDQSAFDYGTRLLLEPEGSAGLTTIHEDTPNHYSIVQTLTHPLIIAPKVVVDPTTHVIYMPHRIDNVRFMYLVLKPSA